MFIFYMSDQKYKRQTKLNDLKEKVLFTNITNK
jgi:hypothetical protein